MTRIALIIGGALIMAGAAFAGTFSSLGSKDEPSIQQAPVSATTTTRQEDRAQERELRGRANEPGEDVRGRENEPGEVRGDGEDLRGPCDEAEHANDPRCTGASPAGANDDRSGHSGRDDSGRDDGGNSGHGGDDGGNSGHGGGGEDD